MPAYKNEKTGKWYCKFYYEDWYGNTQQKKKSGFALKREALEWEREFLNNHQKTPDMPFQAFCDAYIRVKSSEWKPYTADTAKYTIKRLKDFFGDKPLNQITPLDVKKLHVKLKEDGLTPGSINTIHGRLSAVMNHAVTFYGLSSNPCKLSGKVKDPKKEMRYLTLDEYKQLIKKGNLKPNQKIMIELLYWTGMRVGEMLALTPGDIHEDYIYVTKNIAEIDGKTILQNTPKTDNSVRNIRIHKKLYSDLTEYRNKLYGIGNEDRLFNYSRGGLRLMINKACVCAEIKHIRIHDFRHSHVALLIHLGYHTKAIAERIGDTTETVLRVYSHIYPQDVDEMVKKFDMLDV